jgi:amino acid transporter
MQDDFKEATQRKASFGATIRAILWAFLGVRKKSGYEHDAAKLNPIHVMLAGVIAALIFIVMLVIIVKIVVAQ